MFGYYTSLLNTYKKKISLYILLIIFTFIFIGITMGVILVGDEIWLKEGIYVGFSSGTTFIFMVVFWFIFYNNIYRTVIGSNLEILSFTAGLSRKKIFFAKVFAFLTMSLFLSIYMTIILVIPTVAVYQSDGFKILYVILGTFLIGTFGSLTFYFFAFFADTLSKNAKRKRSLAWAPLTSLLVIFGVAWVSEPIILLSIKSSFAIGKGYNDYENNSFYDKNMKKTYELSTSSNLNYSENIFEKSNDEKPRDIDYYNEITTNAKIIGVFTNYLNFKNILETAQGIQRTKKISNSLVEDKIFHHYKGLDTSLFENLAFINAKFAGKTQKMYFHHKPWRYEGIESEKSDNYKTPSQIEAYTTEINGIIEKLKNNPEFQKNEVNFEIIKSFLVPLMDESFSKPSLEIKDASNEADKLSPNYPIDKEWLIGYIYYKANPENKILIFDQVQSFKKEDLDKTEFIDVNGKVHQKPEVTGNSDQEMKKSEEELQAFNDKLNKSLESKLFLSNYTNPNDVVFSRVPTSDYEYPWISWILIAVIILGMGYWSLERYNRQDVA